jgi:hypothetical protein
MSSTRATPPKRGGGAWQMELQRRILANARQHLTPQAGSKKDTYCRIKASLVA